MTKQLSRNEFGNRNRWFLTLGGGGIALFVVDGCQLSLVVVCCK